MAAIISAAKKTLQSLFTFYEIETGVGRMDDWSSINTADFRLLGVDVSLCSTRDKSYVSCRGTDREWSSMMNRDLDLVWE